MKASPEQAERLHRFAHDLRNRLAAIQQVLEQLKDGGTEPSNVELLSFAEQQYFKAMRTTEELLDDLAVERGIVISERGAVDLNALVMRCVASMQHRFDRKQQQVTADIAAQLEVQGDAHWMDQLVCALLSNASKFTRANGHISVALSKQDGRAVITVSDDGVGLSAEDLAHVFERFAWLSSRSTAGEAQGRSTLGRAHQWATAMGGDLTASSAGQGKGSSFVLRLPL